MRLLTLSAISLSGDMFDAYVDTQTETAEAIEKTFSVAGKNCVAILNNYGISASLTVDGITQTVSLIRDSIKDWWDYWFAPVRTGKDIVFYFPSQSSGDATLTISYPGGTAKCGMCVTGVYREIARTLHDINIGISDYSKVLTDAFGQTYFNPGKWAKRANVGMMTLNTNLDIAYREVIKNRATPCIFDYNEYQTSEAYYTSNEGLSALIVYGYTEDFNIRLRTTSMSIIKHDARGLV